MTTDRPYTPLIQRVFVSDPSVNIPPDLRSSAEAPPAAIHRRARPDALAEEIYLLQSCDRR